MRYLALSLFVLATPALAAALAATPAVKDTSYRAADGTRVQQLEVVVNAPPQKVWAALTTDAGFMGWAAPVAHVTLANDGMIEASYRLSAKLGDPDNIKNRIVAYVPNRMLTLHNEHVPKGAPFKPEVIGKIRTVILLDDLGDGRTRVTESGVGYGEGADFDDMYAHFRDGNGEEFTALARYLEAGPTDWKAMAARMTASVGAKN